MIIDEEYSQYEMWRIINRAEADAVAQFAAEKEECAGADDPAQARRKAYEAARREADLQKTQEESTEESLYAVTYSGKLCSLWEKELAL